MQAQGHGTYPCEGTAAGQGRAHGAVCTAHWANQRHCDRLLTSPAQTCWDLVHDEVCEVCEVRWGDGGAGHCGMVAQLA